MRFKTLSSALFLITLMATSSAMAGDLVSWESAEGVKRLERSEAKVDFFPLANHFESQENKVFCGVASSAIVMNALRLNNPDISKPINHTMSKADRRYFPKGKNPEFERYSQQNVLIAGAKDKAEILGKPVIQNGKPAADYGLQLKQLAALLKAHGLEVSAQVADDSVTDEDIRDALITNLKTSDDYVLVNYSRKPLGQKGGGHISPVGAYDEASDSFLILDVNPNAASFVWVESSDLIAAMRTLDTDENRGYVIVQEGE